MGAALTLGLECRTMPPRDFEFEDVDEDDLRWEEARELMEETDLDEEWE